MKKLFKFTFVAAIFVLVAIAILSNNAKAQYCPRSCGSGYQCSGSYATMYYGGYNYCCATYTWWPGQTCNTGGGGGEW
jgi:hypothetical protein